MQIKLRTFVFVIALFLVVLFAAVNWPLFTEMSTMNVLFGTVVAPLGVVMLLVVAGMSVLYLLMLGRAEAGALLGSHRSAKELEEARKLALNAEESRLRDLRAELDERLGRIELTVTEILARTDAPTVRSTVVRDAPATTRVAKAEEVGR